MIIICDRMGPEVSGSLGPALSMRKNTELQTAPAAAASAGFLAPGEQEALCHFTAFSDSINRK